MSFKYMIKNQYPLIAALIVCLSASVVFAFFYWKIGIVFFALTALILIYSVLNGRREFNDLKNSIKAVNKSLDPNGKDMLDHFPMPVLVCDSEGIIVWYNSLFSAQVMGGGIIIENTNIKQFTSNQGLDVIRGHFSINAEYNNKKYSVYQNNVIKNNNSVYVLYFVEDTKLKNIEIEYKLGHPSVILITVDSIEDLYNSYTDSELGEITSGVEKLIENWFSQYSGFLRRTGNGKFIAVVEERHMKQMILSKFDILEKVRSFTYNEIVVGVTLSIGVGRNGSLEECENKARQSLDMALGRGGDQAALKTEIGYDFFGGVSKGIEKHTKVRTRVVAKAIKDLVSSSQFVLIMGHRFADLDSLGSAVGIYKMSVSLGVEARIVMSRKTTLAQPLLKILEEKGLGKIVIEPHDALDKLNSRTLLVVVDTHRPDFVESPELYKNATSVVVIDHHRKTVDHISNAVIFFHEPHASSTSEMVTELVQYVSNKPIIGAIEADALLAGITLDTKNFVLRTGVRTFEAAAYLKSRGADTVEVKQLFSNTMETNKLKNDVVAHSMVYKSTAISIIENNINDIRIVSSQAADEMLNISGINSSYVLFKTGNCVNISARSMGKVNVQLVMERLDGGGHQTMAAAQLEGVSLSEALEKLKKEIDFYEDNGG